MTFALQDQLLGGMDVYTVDTSGPGAYSLAGSTAGKYGRYEYPSTFADAVDPVLGGAVFTFAQVAPIAAQTIASITVAGTTATLNTVAPHGLVPGSVINLSGVAPAGYNGLFVLLTGALSAMTFNVSAPIQPGTSPSNLGQSGVALVNVATPTVAATTVGAYVPGIGAAQAVQFLHALDTFGNLVLQAQVWAGTINSGLSLGVAVCNALATTTISNPVGPFGGQYAWFQIGGAMVAYTAGAPAIGSQTYFSSAGTIQPAAVASKQMQGTQYSTVAGATLGSGVNGRIVLPANQAVIWGTFPLAQGAIT